MSARTMPLPSLYEADEVAWLETMAGLIQTGRAAELDLPHLQEYLTDMAKRDRKEVVSRLIVLLSHLLKWEYQPDKRSESWTSTIVTQQQELLLEFETSTTLRNHAVAKLADAYAKARSRAARETKLPIETFPETFAGTLDDVLAAEAG